MLKAPEAYTHSINYCVSDSCVNIWVSITLYNHDVILQFEVNENIPSSINRSFFSILFLNCFSYFSQFVILLKAYIDIKLGYL